MSLRLPEFILGQIVLYSIIFLIDGYAGFLVCLILASIAFAALLFAIVVELIERSKVTRMYFVYLGLCIICPLLVMAIFMTYDPAATAWMNE